MQSRSWRQETAGHINIVQLPLGGRLRRGAFHAPPYIPFTILWVKCRSDIDTCYVKIRDRITPVHIIVLGLLFSRSERGQKSICLKPLEINFFLCYRLAYMLQLFCLNSPPFLRASLLPKFFYILLDYSFFTMMC